MLIGFDIDLNRGFQHDPFFYSVLLCFPLKGFFIQIQGKTIFIDSFIWYTYFHYDNEMEKLAAAPKVAKWGGQGGGVGARDSSLKFKKGVSSFTI